MLEAESTVEHPRRLALAGVAGTTALRLLVSAQGRVDSVEVAQSSGHSGLDSAAVRGAGRMTFKPALSGGRPVPAWVDVPVRFGGTVAGKAGAPPAERRDSAAPPAPGPAR